MVTVFDEEAVRAAEVLGVTLWGFNTITQSAGSVFSLDHAKQVVREHPGQKFVQADVSETDLERIRTK